MAGRAIVIGIDAYETEPLQSCVQDAQAFGAALVELGLVTADEVTLLTAPAPDEDHLATSARVSRALFDVYDAGAGLDRLYVYFSGHGLMAQVGAARARLANYIVPSDVKDPRFEGNLLINVDDLRARLRLAGPKEQFLFFDCCRNVAWGDPPELGALTWPRTSTPSDEANAQATLFAVSPKGKAIARDGTTSLVTEHLLDALRGRGRSLDWSEADGAYVVTIESMKQHVRQAVRSAVADQPLWGRDHVLPDCEVVGSIGPLRIVDEPEPVSLVLKVEPVDAAPATRIRLTKGGDVLAEPSWPPAAVGAEVKVRPQRYGIRAESDAGAASPDPAVIDARVVSVAVVRVGDQPTTPSATPAARAPSQAVAETAAAPPAAAVAAPPAMPAAAAPPATDAPPGVDAAPPDVDAAPPGVDVAPPGVDAAPAAAPRPAAAPVEPARVMARAEPHVSIEVRALEPPYHTISGVGSVVAEVAPGFHRVRFRLGNELFSERELDVAPGQQIEVVPNVVSSPLLFETLQWDAPQHDAVISETIGPMQGGVVETMLAMLAVKPFDVHGELFHRFHGLVPVVDPTAHDRRPLALVVAFDGGPWPVPVPEMLAGVTAEVAPREAAAAASSPVELRRVRDDPGGLGRIALGVATPPPGASVLRLRSPQLGTIDFAVCSMGGRVTALTVLVLPNGSLLVGEHLLAVPGEWRDQPEAAIAPYGVLVRQLTVGQQLYRSRELVGNGTAAGDVLGAVLAGSVVDPVLSTMAAWSWLDAATDAAAGGDPEGARQATASAARVASALGDRYPTLPDASVVRAVVLDDRAALDALPAGGSMPLLARSCDELARLEGPPSTGGAIGRLDPKSAWNVVWEPA